MRKRFAITAVAIAASAALLLTGCVNNESPSATDQPGSSKPAATTVDEAAAALVPAAIKDSGVFIMGVDATYPPNAYKDDAGAPIGWEIDLGNVLAAKLGLKPEWKLAAFDNIIPSVTGGTMDAGVSSFTDNVEREKQVDFVNYYTAGILWASQAGKTVNPDDACGLTVSVQSTTVEDTEELPAKNDACLAAGKPGINKLKFDSQDLATLAVIDGRADAMTGDSPITEYAVSKSDGKLQVAGKSFDVAPYGVAVNKGSELAKAVQAAFQSMVDDGSYLAILNDWGVASGALTDITINAASKG
ncbi:ABC transporter substrate-binding protein [Homoserinimonas sp. OAct 916]|uniref:ABC transporter substrate-binding protein n=1 Tax=Homoserinimonas sp. OAct 916 TaxID=2211450 RepID=UPI000DBE3B17|nr:ABC transporter substrate-binding protein [Homoserinimonas sp. OAct 916]